MIGWNAKILEEERQRARANERFLRPGQLFRVVLGEYDDGCEGEFGFIYADEPFVLISPEPYTYPDGTTSMTDYWMILCHWGIIRKSTSYIESCCEFVPGTVSA